MPSPESVGAQASSNISPARFRIRRPLRSQRIWRGFWPPTRATAFPVSSASTLGGDALAALRGALEEGLGVRFDGKQGIEFFSLNAGADALLRRVFRLGALGETITPQPTAKFNWHEAVWHLRAPVLAAHCFRRSRPPTACNSSIWSRCWTGRPPRWIAWIEKPSSLASAEGEAVPYFYEPFLEEFDPALRKQLGVWYTPNEVVRYMVARVDKALKNDLGIADGLAAENVYVLGPLLRHGGLLGRSAEACRRRIWRALGVGALAGARVKEAALKARVRLRDHARPLRRRAFTSRPRPGRTRRTAGR